MTFLPEPGPLDARSMPRLYIDAKPGIFVHRRHGGRGRRC
jgi:hypothetical protein